MSAVLFFRYRFHINNFAVLEEVLVLKGMETADCDIKEIINEITVCQIL